ncbi:hypothetical protein DL771_005818 [Monosporascus sp. 5C6A]|nr:hypothetical protein DL771_005818 [Monosporascus sp. 5C6A]
MEPFRIPPDMVTLLNDIDEEELQCFVELHEDPVSDAQIELSIFALFLAFERAGKRELLRRAIDRAEGWAAVAAAIPAEDNTAAADRDRRLEILSMLSGRLMLLEEEEEGVRHQASGGRRALIISLGGSLLSGIVSSSHPSLDSAARELTAYLADFREDLDEAFAMAQSTAITPENSEQQSRVLFDFGMRYGDRFEGTGDRGDIDKAINAFSKAADALPFDSPNRATALVNKGCALHTRFQETGAEEDLVGALAAMKIAVDATPHNDPTRVDRLFRHLALLNARRTDAETDHDDVVSAASALVEAAPLDHPRRYLALRMSATQLGLRFNQTGDIEDLDRAIKVLNEAMDSRSHLEDSERLELLELLEYSLDRRFMSETNNTAGDLERAIEVVQRAVGITSTSDSGWVTWLKELRKWLRRQYKMTNRPEILDRLIDVSKMVLDAVPQESPDRAGALSSLALHLERRFGRIGSIDDIDAAVGYKKMAVDTLPPSHEDLGYHFGGLARLLDKRFRRNQSTEDVENAIKAARRSLDAAADHGDDETQLSSLNTLAGIFCSRFENTGSDSDLDESIKLFEMAVDSLSKTPDDDPGAILNSFAMTLGRRFERRGVVDDLNRAIDTAHKAVNLTGLDNRDRPARLNTLALWIGTRFESNGSMDDLDAAIEVSQAAFDAGSSADYDLRAGLASNLEMWLSKRFERTGNEEDLRRSIGLTEKAIETLPENEPARAGLMINLSNRLTAALPLSANISESGAVGDSFEKAIEVLKKGLDLLALNHPARSLALYNLGQLFRSRYRRTHDPADLMNAVDVAGGSVGALASGHPNRAAFLLSLGKALEMRYRHRITFERISDCINLVSDGRGDNVSDASTVPNSETDRTASSHYRLPHRLRKRFKLPGPVEDLEQSISSFMEGWSCENAAPSIRIMLAREGARMLAVTADWGEASKLLRGAVELLPAISPRIILKDSDKQDMLAGFDGLASSAAATALNAGEEPQHALALLELGRGIIAGLLLEARSDITDLEEKHPGLANDFRCIRDQLESLGDLVPSNSTTSPSEFELKSKRRWDADKKFREVIQEIRALPEFQNFLLPPTATEMMAAADPDPVVVVNASSYRCDAFLVWRQRVQLLELPDLRLEDIESKARLLRDAASTDFSVVGPVLEWLWEVAACPILEALGFRGPEPSSFDEDNGRCGSQSQPQPRIWWVLAGSLSQLPFHAAGLHKLVGSNDTVLDRAMSSYSLSIKALIYGRRNNIWKPTDMELGSESVTRHALLVAMQKTPGLPASADLPCAADEIAMLESLCPKLGLTPAQPLRIRDEVLASLRTCEIFHFAGHGEVDPSVPSKSCLLLDDWQSSPLTVEHLRQQRLVHGNVSPPFLGYLSACSTGANTVQSLVDESIHLISACQLAGFRHVIGTLWEVSDKLSVEVAGIFYETLYAEGMADGSMRADEAVCKALHRAVRTLRDADINATIKASKAARGERKDESSESAGAQCDDQNSDSMPNSKAREEDLDVSEKMDEETRRDNTPLRNNQTPEEGTGERNLVLVARKRRRMFFSWVPYVHYGV